ncbi:MAG: recombinase family protein [Coprococcus sp.]
MPTSPFTFCEWWQAFYACLFLYLIGTLRQHKYTRKKIHGADTKVDESEHFVFENHHEAIIDYKTWAYTQEQLKKENHNALPWCEEI